MRKYWLPLVFALALMYTHPAPAPVTVRAPSVAYGAQQVGSGGIFTPVPPFPVAFNFEQITFNNSSTGFSTLVYAPANQVPAQQALFSCETPGATLRFRYDVQATLGSPPTSTSGIVVNQGDVWVITGAANVAQFRAVRGGSTSVLCDISYSR